MILTERHHIKPSHTFFNECDMLAYASKNLYNSSLYMIKEHLHTHDSFVAGTYTDKSGKDRTQWVHSSTHIYHRMKDKPEFRTDTHSEYGGLKINTKVLKQTQKQVSNAFSHYFRALSDWKKNPSKYTGMPQLPKYKKKTGRNVVTFPKDAISFKKRDGYIHLGGTNIFIKPYNAMKENTKEVKIVPLVHGYDIIISYELADIDQITDMHENYAAIDLGLNNLATLTSNDTSFTPFIVNGRPLKSINQYFNKRKSKLTSELPKNVYASKRIAKLCSKRHNKIRDYMHKASDHIVKQLSLSGVTCLIVGSNKNWKTDINIGKRNNQNFVSIPFYKFKAMLRYKCALAGIEYIEHEESYTSKCSFLDMEGIHKQVDITGNDSYQGRRTKRGLFKSSSGVLINADMNGSYNILRKVAGNDVFVYTNTSDLVEDYAVSPTRVTID